MLTQGVILTNESFNGHVTVGSATRYSSMEEEEDGAYIPQHCARKAKKTKSRRSGGSRYPVLSSMAYMGLSTDGRMAAVQAVAPELL